MNPGGGEVADVLVPERMEIKYAIGGILKHQHGALSLQLLDADPNLKLVGTRWSPPHNSTTAYAVHSLAFPVVDGRIFVRGMNGIYCYDLRKAK